MTKLFNPAMLSTSDKARYVADGAGAGAPDGHCARLPQYAAGVLRCTACVRGRAGQQHWHASAAKRMRLLGEGLPRALRRPSLAGGAPEGEALYSRPLAAAEVGRGAGRGSQGGRGRGLDVDNHLRYSAVIALDNRLRCSALLPETPI
jgi:hypothetical protein